MKFFIKIFILLLLILLSGCVKITYKEITPIKPKPCNAYNLPFLNPIMVESLKPTFIWEKSSDPSVSYDFVIWECVHGIGPGKVYYYREGLKESQHVLEKSLRPDHEYYWSVRIRREAIVGYWARYDWRAFPIWLGYEWANDQRFFIKTPKK